MTYDIDNKRFYRNTAKGKISGVCAGFADYFSIDPWVVRGIAVLGMFWAPITLAVAYLLSIVLLPAKR